MNYTGIQIVNDLLGEKEPQMEKLSKEVKHENPGSFSYNPSGTSPVSKLCT